MQKAPHWCYEVSQFKTFSRDFVERVLPSINGTVQQRYLAAGESMKMDGSNLWAVREGNLEVWIDSKLVCCLEEGEVLGPWFSCSTKLEFVSVNDGCHIVGYKNDELSTFFRQAPAAFATWSDLVGAASGYFFNQFAAAKLKGAPPAPKFRQFASGETILKEGEFSGEVLCLVDGDADVISSGAKVGKVKEEEIFGALAALTGAPRMASVVATKPSVCMVFERDAFEDLLRSHTALMSKLFEDLARAMHEANAKIAALEGKQQRESFGSRWF